MHNAAEIKKKLNNDKVTIGSWIQIPSTAIAEIMGSAGYDWIAIDLEHGAFSTSDLPDMIRAIELGGAVPFVRIAQIDKKDIKHALDSGAKGIIFPMVESADQLQNAVSWSSYPPKGKRGVGYSRANLYGERFDEYIQDIDENLILVAQIEDIKAVDCLNDILNVQGLDAIIVGPYDLSGSMGLTAEFNNPKFLSVIEKIRDMAKQNKVPMGIHIVQPDELQLQKNIYDGYQFIAYGTDGVFLYTSSKRPEL